MNPDAEPMDDHSRTREVVAVIDPARPSNEPASKKLTSPANGPRVGRVVVVSLLLLGAAFAFGLIPRLKQRAEVHADTSELALATVNTIAPARAKAGPPLVLSGELRPLMEAPIYARANGYVRRWLVDIGATVKQGELLAELDTPELDREHAQARAELAQAEAARALAESTAKRWREMLAGKTVSSQEADEKFADVELKKATVEAARARAERLANLLGFAKVTAPFAGTVTGRQIDVGQLITGGGNNELFRLAQTEKLRVFVRVPQSYARAVVIGQTAELTVPEIPGRKFEGKILRTAGAMDAASRTLLSEIEVDNTGGELLAGSYAQVRLSDARPDALLTLPSNTILFRAEGPQVAVVENQRATMRVVTLGRDFGATVEILDGVTAQDRVIMNPADSLVNGIEVRVSDVSR
jgi:membrane fusion protein (multidrug efflux system)